METTLQDELQALHDTLRTYAATKPAGEALVYFLANDVRQYYAMANLNGDVLAETTQAVFHRFVAIFSVTLLYVDDHKTHFWGFKAADIEKVDDASGLPLVELLLQEPPAA